MCCCSTADATTAPASSPESPENTGPPTWPRRLAALIQWAIPLTTLALIPKCPACIAAYVLLFTGIGLSLPAAAAMRWAIIAVSTAALLFLCFRAAHRAMRAAHTSRPFPSHRPTS